MTVTHDDYSRADALRDGLLVDVSDIAGRLGILFPVAMSAALFNHRGIARERRTEHLEYIVQSGLGAARWLAGEECGESVYGVVLDHGTGVWPVEVQMYVEPSPDGHGVVATLLRYGEKYDLRAPRASLYEN